jgi:hypothetical protein
MGGHVHRPWDCLVVFCMLSYLHLLHTICVLFPLLFYLLFYLLFKLLLYLLFYPLSNLRPSSFSYF